VTIRMPCEPDSSDVMEKRIRELEGLLADSEKRLHALSIDSFHLRTLMEEIPDPIYFKDAQSRFIRVNRAWAEKHRVPSPSDVVSKTDYDFFPRDFADATMKDERIIVSQGTSASKIEKFESGNDVRWFSSSKVPIRDQDNGIVGTCGISRDITVVKRAEEMLEQANSILGQRVQEKTRDLLEANRLLEERVRQLHFLNKVSYSISQKTTVNDTCRVIASSFCENFEKADCAICRFSTDGLAVLNATGNFNNGPGRSFLETAVPRFNRTSSREMVLESKHQEDGPVPPPDFPDFAEHVLFIPLLADENNVGVVVMSLDSHGADCFKKETSLVRTLASISGMSLEKAFQQSTIKEKARLEGELTAARRIQQTLIPKARSVFPHVIIECDYRPAFEVGGDYLDYFVNDTGNLIIAIGDVCGKGVPAALLMSMLRTTLRIHAAKKASAAELLIDVHESMKDKLSITSFISLLCCIINPETMTMTYARAGHPPLLQMGENGAPPLSHVTRGIALGMEDNTSIFSSLLSEKTFPIKKGDRFFMYTDGIVESPLPDGSFFGLDRLKRLLSASHSLEPHKVISSVAEIALDKKLLDDATAISIEIC
jgi:PAS domain S-box-containing protein